jgi:hypothetical protein
MLKVNLENIGKDDKLWQMPLNFKEFDLIKLQAT